MKGRLLYVFLSAFFALSTLAAHAQAAAEAATATPEVSRSISAITFRQKGGATKLEFHGTDKMQLADGEAKVEAKSGRVEIEARFAGIDEATKFGLEYLTYVLWAITPQGRAVNLGEVVLKNGTSQLRATTELQTFGLIVTAEPYFSVTQPSDLVVLEGQQVEVPGKSAGQTTEISASYGLLPRGAYSSTNAPIREAIFGIDRKTPLAIFEARNAVRIAHLAGGEKYAAAMLARADQQLRDAESAYAAKQKDAAITAARSTAQTAEEARVMAVHAQQQERETAQRRAAEELAARARADAATEAQRRAAAEQASQRAIQERQAAEQAKAEAERMKQQAEQAAQEAARAAEEAARQRQEAEAARQAALQQQEALRAQAEQARQAMEQSEKARQSAEQEKAELRAKLLAQLNSILDTRESARGLIANMGDVLFETGRFELRPAARERLAKVSGILLAYSSLKVAVEGHTDSVGSDEFNQTLSERRAQAVRDYFVQQGVPESAISYRGFGKTQPIASNDTAEGRQRNRRVELVVSGEAIGVSAKGPETDKQ